MSSSTTGVLGFSSEFSLALPHPVPKTGWVPAHPYFLTSSILLNPFFLDHIINSSSFTSYLLPIRMYPTFLGQTTNCELPARRLSDALPPFLIQFTLKLSSFTLPCTKPGLSSSVSAEFPVTRLQTPDSSLPPLAALSSPTGYQHPSPGYFSSAMFWSFFPSSSLMAPHQCRPSLSLILLKKR